MSDEPKRIITKDNLHPFSKMNRAATRQEAVNAAVNSAQGVYDLLSAEHDRIMGEVVQRFEDNERDFNEFRQRAARRIREIERRSFSYIVLTALRHDWLRFKLWLTELRYPPGITGAALEEQRAGVVGGIHPEDVDLAKLGPPEEIVTIESDGSIHSDPIVKPATNDATPGATCGCDWVKGENCLLCAPPKAEG